MGIKFFFTWLKQNFGSSMKNFSKKSFPSSEVSIDNFLIDLNGVIHYAAAKAFEYGAFEKPKGLLQRKGTPRSYESLENKCFEEVCARINEMVTMLQPKKRLIICIDGVAPLGKQNQQRQRRFRASLENQNQSNFDSCVITPGSKFLDRLSSRIDFFVRKMISENPTYAKLDIIFSSEKTPGEGEHKLVNFIRKFGTDEESYCINALDADLVMLSLATHKENFYLLREDTFTPGIDYGIIDMKSVKKALIYDVLGFNISSMLNVKQVIHDFVLICFLCGNDFLPNVPSISIMDKGLDVIIDMYQMTIKSKGFLTTFPEAEINLENFSFFLSLLGKTEKSLLLEKAMHIQDYFPDPLLEKFLIKKEDGVFDFDYEGYKKAYYEHHNLSKDTELVCHRYITGCRWVLSYYVKGVQDWNWLFPFFYAPFASDLSESIKSYFDFHPFSKSEPVSPFEQLLAVCPPRSGVKILPRPLNELFNPSSNLAKFYPSKDQIMINVEGKRKEWEGVVELPLVDMEEIKKVFKNVIKRVHFEEKKRNLIMPSNLYKFSIDGFVTEVKGIKNCCVEVKPIDI